MVKVILGASAWTALCLACGSVDAGQPVETTASAWVQTLLPMHEDGWENVAVTDQRVVVSVAFRSAVRDGSIVTASVRAEWMNPQETPHTRISKFLSTISRIEYNCATGSYRNLFDVAYAGNNLSGEASSPDTSALGAWGTLFPEPIAQQILTAVCHRTEGSIRPVKGSS